MRARSGTLKDRVAWVQFRPFHVKRSRRGEWTSVEWRASPSAQIARHCSGRGAVRVHCGAHSRVPVGGAGRAPASASASAAPVVSLGCGGAGHAVAHDNNKDAGLLTAVGRAGLADPSHFKARRSGQQQGPQIRSTSGPDGLQNPVPPREGSPGAWPLAIGFFSEGPGAVGGRRCGRRGLRLPRSDRDSTQGGVAQSSYTVLRSASIRAKIHGGELFVLAEEWERAPGTHPCFRAVTR